MMDPYRGNGGCFGGSLLPSPSKKKLIQSLSVVQQRSRKKYPAKASDYTLYEEVGVGSSAIVYRALCVPFKEIVAIKVVDLDKSSATLDRICHGVQVMALISHPNVLQAHCSFVVDYNLWVVMPYIAGGSCLHLLKAKYQEGLKESVIASFLREVLKALYYLHIQGQIHQNVKAGNILVDASGAVILGDFGFSTCTFDNGDTQCSTQAFIGTSYWMAPEVKEQRHSCGPEVDIWSFGITALELSQGHDSFNKYSPTKVVQTYLQGLNGGNNYERHKKLSKPFLEMIAKCLKKDPLKRPSAIKLLKHSFFKNAPNSEVVAETVFNGLPPLGDQFKALKLKEAGIFEQKKVASEEKEDQSQSEHKRGMSSWNFHLEDLEFRSSSIQDDEELYSTKAIENPNRMKEIESMVKAESVGAESNGQAKYFKKRHGSVLSFPSRLNVDGDHRRGNQAVYDQAVGPGFDSLNGCVRLTSGRARGINTGQWAPPDSRFPSYESVDFPSAIAPFRPAAATLYTRPILNHGNPTNPPWVAFGSIPGMPNGGLKQPHLFNTGLQGGRGLSLSSTLRVGVGIGRPRCRDFEERGFCLRGDMCPMEHGANRIVVDDVQSLSQYNLSVPVPTRQLVGKGTGPSSGPSADLTRNISREKSIGYGSNRDSEHLNVSPTSAAGIEADLYDPDQPLLNNAHPGGSRGLKPHKKGDDEHLWDGNAPAGLGNDILGVDDNVRPQRCGSSIGLSHNAFPSVWDRIGPVDYACNKHEEGLRVADVFDGSLQHGKQSKKELYGNRDFRSHSEERDKESDSDHDSGSKDVNIRIRNGKVRGTSKSRVPKESVYDSQKIAETSSDATHKNAVHKSGRRGSEKAQRTLYVSCIPPKSNKVESLLLHFRKFGEVLGVRIPPNSDKAFVQYSCREEAEAALTSPDAVMGNRFIRLAWAHWDSSTKQEKISAAVVPSGTSLGAMSVALPYPQPHKQKNSNSISFSVGLSTSEVSHSADTNSAKSVNVKELSSTISATHKQETLETLKLIREKQEILAQKREDFRRRLEKLTKQGVDSRGDSSDKSRAAKRQKTEDLVTCSNNSPSSASLGTVSGPAFMTRNEQGGTNLTSKGVMNELSGSRSLSPAGISMPLPKNSKIPLCSSSGSLTEPVCSPYQFKMDDWPTAFRILPPLPYGLMDIIGLKEHFASFGDLTSVELEDVQSGCDGASKRPETCSVLVTYDTRHAAERAFVEGSCWQGKKLQLAWAITSNTTNQVSTKNHLPQNLKWDSRRGPLTEKETSGGKTITMNDITNTNKSVEEYLL